MLDSGRRYFDCLGIAAAEQCGEEIGRYVAELAARIEETCDFSEKRQTSKAQCRQKLNVDFLIC